MVSTDKGRIVRKSDVCGNMGRLVIAPMGWGITFGEQESARRLVGPEKEGRCSWTLREKTRGDTLVSMRIIAGQWRGRQIAGPAGGRTRPITDRAKTVLFDVLGHRLARPGTLPPLAVLDLFAGTGTLGIECLSRGAGFALFVEQHRPTVALIRENLASLGILEGQGQVLCADTTQCQFPRPQGSPGVYSLVLVDPPYRLLIGPSPHPYLRPLLQKLALDPVIADGAMIVVRHPRTPLGGPSLAPLVEIERRDVGSMTFRFMGTPRHAAGVRSEALSRDEETG